jgi:hypothetical protein
VSPEIVNAVIVLFLMAIIVWAHFRLDRIGQRIDSIVDIVTRRSPP